MLFQELRVQDIRAVLRFRSRRRVFVSQVRRTHILGVQLSGRAMHHFADRSEILEPGQLYYFDPGDDYRVEILEPGIAFSVHFTASAPFFLPSFFARVDDASEVIACMERLERSFAAGGCCPDAMSELYRLIALFAARVRLPVPPRDRRMDEATEHLRLHFREKGCIARAAGICGVTPRRFTDLFSARYHITPNRFLMNVRLERARQLLCAEELSLAQAAELSGFSDVYYFSKAFKRETGVPPGAWRKQRV